MRDQGFSLVEMMVVIFIVSVLTGIAVLSFNEYLRRDNKQNQTRMIHGELMQARLRSLTERRGRVVKLGRTSFAVYSSTVDEDQGAAPQLTLTLQFPIVWGGGGSAVQIDDRGMVIAGLRSICLEDRRDVQLVDSVVVGSSRINLGMRSVGGGCNGDSITVK